MVAGLNLAYLQQGLREIGERGSPGFEVVPTSASY